MQGLDPASRRNLWDVVKNAKHNRGIILTTHSMEEAEVTPLILPAVSNSTPDLFNACDCMQHADLRWRRCFPFCLLPELVLMLALALQGDVFCLERARTCKTQGGGGGA